MLVVATRLPACDCSSGDMDVLSTAEIFIFGDFRLDWRGGGLFRCVEGSSPVPVSIGSRALRVLGILVERHGNIVPKDDIMAAVWPETVVEEANLTVQISALRRTLDPEGAGLSQIQTIPGHGYRFIAPVTRITAAGGTPLPHTTAGRQPPPPLSIMVTPLRNLGVPKAFARLVDGIGEDISTDLSHYAGIRVVCGPPGLRRNGTSASPRDLARELSASYLVQGSVRKAEDRVRVKVQLIDTDSGVYVWAERFDVDLDGTADACGEITGRLVRVLSVKLTEHAGRSVETMPPREWTSCDLVMRGRALNCRPISITNKHAALRCFERALATDAGSIGARIGIAGVLVTNVAEGWSRSVERDIAHAEQLLLDVLRDDADIPEARGYMGLLRRLQGRLSDSMVELEIGRGLESNNIRANMQLGWTLIHLGRPAAAIPRIEKCIRLAPHDQLTPVSYAALGLSKLLMQHIDEAIFCLRKARAGNPRLYYPHLYLAAALRLRGELGEAEAALRQAIEVRPEIALPSGFLPVWQVSSQFAALFERTVCTGLRRAGLPAVWADASERLIR
jgi:adenylate cyclase